MWSERQEDVAVQFELKQPGKPGMFLSKMWPSSYALFYEHWFLTIFLQQHAVNVHFRVKLNVWVRPIQQNGDNIFSLSCFLTLDIIVGDFLLYPLLVTMCDTPEQLLGFKISPVNHNVLPHKNCLSANQNCKIYIWQKSIYFPALFKNVCQ